VIGRYRVEPPESRPLGGARSTFSSGCVDQIRGAKAPDGSECPQRFELSRGLLRTRRWWAADKVFNRPLRPGAPSDLSRRSGPWAGSRPALGPRWGRSRPHLRGRCNGTAGTARGRVTSCTGCGDASSSCLPESPGRCATRCPGPHDQSEWLSRVVSSAALFRRLVFARNLVSEHDDVRGSGLD